jgi:hypothetical protein
VPGRPFGANGVKFSSDNDPEKTANIITSNNTDRFILAEQRHDK